jgi:hypothetical protein
MSNYTQSTNFTAKDSLPSGDAAKKVKGVDFDGEFGPIATAVATKVDKTGATMTGNLDFGDDHRLRLGAGNDLQVWHDGSHSYISDIGTGELRIGAADSIRLMNADFTKTALLLSTLGTGAGTAYLMFDNNSKLATTNTGIDVTGTVVSDGLTVDGASTTKTLVVDNSANGVVQEFKLGGTVCGGVRTTVSGGIPDITLGNDVVGLRFVRAAGGASANISPTSVADNSAQDDLIDLGRSAARFDDIFATNGTINTSDATEKQSIEELTEAEIRVAQTCKGLVRKFKWNSAVEKKGIEGARYHFGVMAQDVQAAFASEGLSAEDYGVFVSETWTNEAGAEQTRLGVRYTELLAFIIGGLV